METLKALRSTGLVLVKFTRQRGAYRVGDTGGLPPKDAAVLLGLEEIELAPIPVGVEMIDTGVTPGPGLPPDPEPHDPEALRRAAIEIPADWRGEHHLKRIRLATEIIGTKVTSAADADGAISAEMKRRAG